MVHFSEVIFHENQILIEVVHIPFQYFFKSDGSIVLVDIKIWQDTLPHCYEMFFK